MAFTALAMMVRCEVNLPNKKSQVVKYNNLAFCVSGWQDSNLRPPHPKCGAIPGYATPRFSLSVRKGNESCHSCKLNFAFFSREKSVEC